MEKIEEENTTPKNERKSQFIGTEVSLKKEQLFESEGANILSSNYS